MVENKDKVLGSDADETGSGFAELIEETTDDLTGSVDVSEVGETADKELGETYGAATAAVQSVGVKKNSFDWTKGIRILSWVLFALIIFYNGFNAYSSMSMSKLYIALYAGYGLFYGCSVLFGMHVVANIADDTAKSASYLERLTALKEEQLKK